MNKLKVIVISGILLLICVFCTVSYANPEERIKMSVRAGYNDTIRIYSDCPVYIEMENSGKDFQGEIQVHSEAGYEKKMIYALPFEIPEGSKKEFLMNVPVNTASKDLEIKIVQNGKELFIKKHSLKKIISPEMPVVGTLTNEGKGFGGLHSARVSEKMLLERENFFVPQVSLKKTSVFSESKAAVEVIELNENNLPENEDLLDTFDFIIISDYDTSLLTESQKTAISNWVNKGNILVIGTGENARKVYSGLHESLTPFKISGQKTLEKSQYPDNFYEKTPPEEDMYISTGKAGDGDIVLGDDKTPLALNYKYGNGNIIVLSFDPTSRPISNWNYNTEMWEKILEYNIVKDYGNTVGYRYSHYSYLNNMSEEDAFHFGFLCVIILLYILLVGPVLYWILKYKDKRDYSWVVIPILSFLFVGIIYAGGYSTRFKASVVNNYSVIKLDADSEKININSFLAIYNNKRGTLKIESPTKYNLNLHLNNYYNYDIFNPQSGSIQNYDVISKISFGEPKTYEVYNMALWDFVEAKAGMYKEYKEKITFESIEVKDGKISGTINNNTSLALEDCYLILEGLYVFIGDMGPKSEKNLNIDLYDKSVQSNFDRFMGDIYYASYNSDEYKKKERSREAHFIAHNNFIQEINGGDNLRGKQIIFAALNYDDVGYELMINGTAPKMYNINVIYTVENIMYEKGENVIIPKGVIKPVLDNPENFTVENYMTYVFFNDTEARLTFNIQRDIIVKEFEIDWSNVNYEYYYSDEEIDDMLNSYKLYIRNNVTDEWEEIDKLFKVSADVERYINGFNQIKVKADIKFDDYRYGSEVLIMPEIEVRGVAK